MGFTRGDHIKAVRMGYAHHGIYVGEGKVLHYLDNRGICECSLEEFADGMPTDTVPYLVFDTFAPEEIVRRAYSRIGESEYNLVFKNCEHFATWCACGLEHSGQVQRATAAMAGVGAFVAKRAVVKVAGGAVLGSTVTTTTAGAAAGAGVGKAGLACVATAKAAGAGGAAKLGAVGLGSAGAAGVVGAVSAPFLLAAGAVVLMGVGFAWLLDED